MFSYLNQMERSLGFVALLTHIVSRYTAAISFIGLYRLAKTPNWAVLFGYSVRIHRRSHLSTERFSYFVALWRLKWRAATQRNFGVQFALQFENTLKIKKRCPEINTAMLERLCKVLLTRSCVREYRYRYRYRYFFKRHLPISGK